MEQTQNQQNFDQDIRENAVRESSFLNSAISQKTTPLAASNASQVRDSALKLSRLPTVPTENLEQSTLRGQHSQQQSQERFQKQQSSIQRLTSPVTNASKTASINPHSSINSIEEQELIGKLNAKLLKLRQENDQLQTQCDFICDNETHMNYESEIKAATKRLVEEKQKLLLLTKQCNDQADGINQYKLINKVDVYTELSSQLQQIEEKVGQAEEELTSLTQYLNVVQQAEKDLVRLIPQFYHLLIKYDVADQKFNMIIDKMRLFFNKMKQSQIELDVKQLSNQAQSEDSKLKEQQLQQDIADIKLMMEQQREQHASNVQQARQKQHQLEQDLVELTFNYQLLIKQFSEQLDVKTSGAKDSFDLDE